MTDTVSLTDGAAHEHSGVSSATSGFTHEDLLKIKSITEKAKKEGRKSAEEALKDCAGCKEGKKIAPVQFSEIEERHREKARRLLNDIEAVKKLLKSQTESDDAAHQNEQSKRTILTTSQRPRRSRCRSRCLCLSPKKHKP